MDAVTIIEYVLALTAIIYLVGLLLAWLYELKKNALYSEMQRQLKGLEKLRLSAALGQIKIYKIQQDYRRSAQALEGVQQFIFENVLFIARHTGRNGKSFHV